MTTWCRYIKNDIRARICAGHELPRDLTLHALAAQYAVSLTPVRTAINELLEEQYLRKLDNGRLAINALKVGSGGTTTELERPQPPKDYFEEITNDLVVLCLRGRAAFLREEETASRYGISGTALRQVFNRLAGAGLLEHVPRRGWRLRPFTQARVEEYTQVREVLELEALKLAWPRLDDQELRAIRDGNVLPATEDDLPLVDDSVHAYLVEKSGNEFIQDFFARHGRYFATFFNWEALDRVAAIETVHQHRALLDALLRRNRAAARRALVEHLRYNHAALKRLMPQRLDAPTELVDDGAA